MEGIARCWWISARDLEGWPQEVLEGQGGAEEHADRSNSSPLDQSRMAIKASSKLMKKENFHFRGKF